METSQYTINRILKHLPLSTFTDGRKPQVLEPSAGRGKLAKAILLKRDVDVICCELNKNNRDYLAEKGFRIVGSDFLTRNFNSWSENEVFGFYVKGRLEFDYVVAVPPYWDNIDCIHIQKMYDVCKKGGKVISLTLPHWITGFFEVQREFRQWLQGKDYSLEILPDEDESYLNAPKAIIVINK